MDTRIYKNTCIQGYTGIGGYKDIKELTDMWMYKKTSIQRYTIIWIQGYTRILVYKDI